jgi:hypothetical protein
MNNAPTETLTVNGRAMHNPILLRLWNEVEQMPAGASPVKPALVGSRATKALSSRAEEREETPKRVLYNFD